MDQRKIIAGQYPPHFADQQDQLVLLELTVKMDQLEVQLMEKLVHQDQSDQPDQPDQPDQQVLLE
jgi:hypothetical protein